MKTITLVLLVATLCAPAWAQLKIVTTTTCFADLARQIGEDKVQVRSVMKGPENTHNVLATPAAMVFLNQADLFVHSGLDAEPWRDNLLRGARNPRVNPGQPGYVDMSAGIELKDVPAGRIDRSLGDIHAFGDPHYSLSLHNAKQMVVTLTHALARADPDHAPFYKDNAKRLVTELEELAEEARLKFAPWAGLKVVTFHRAWSYFADVIPLDIVGTIEPQPAITPSPAQVRQLVDKMKTQGVKIVVVETYSSLTQAQRVADLAGARVVILPDHVHGLPEADTYQNLIRTNVDKLIAAAKEAGLEAH